MLCIFGYIHCIENQAVKREPQEWDAVAYEKGSDLPTKSFLEFLDKNNIEIEEHRILDVGCGTGRLSAIYAETAEEVHAFDASEQMITFAQEKYKDKENLSFEHCFAEDFTSKKLYQLALASSALHWVKDKKQAFEKINKSLEQGGELFFDIRTAENRQPIALIAAGEMISEIPVVNWIISKDNIMNYIGSPYLTKEELRTMLINANFEIIKCEEQYLQYTVTKEELKLSEWPTVTSRPIMPWVRTIFSEEKIQYYFNKFIDRMAENMHITSGGKYVYPIDKTIVHARKK